MKHLLVKLLLTVLLIGGVSEIATAQGSRNLRTKRLVLDDDETTNKSYLQFQAAADLTGDGSTHTYTFPTPALGIMKSAANGVLSLSAVDLASADVTGILGVTKGGTGTNTQFTAGSIVFAGASGVYSQDNTNLFWDNGNKRFGIGNAAPSVALDVTGAIKASTSITAGNSLTVTTGGATITEGGLTVSADGANITGATEINTGNGDGTTSIGNAGDALELTGDTWSITAAGAVTTQGNMTSTGGTLELGLESETPVPGQIVFQDNTDNAFSGTLKTVGELTGNRVWTLPDASGELVTNLSAVNYNVSAPQASATPRTNNLFNVAYASGAADANAAGAVITSSSGAAGNGDATGLTISATANGTGDARGLVVSASGGDDAVALQVTAGGANIAGATGITGATTILGTTQINVSGTAATSIGTAGGATNIGDATSANTILGTTAVTGVANVNTTGTAATNIGTAGGATNIGDATSSNTILGTTAVTGVANVNTTGTAATNIGTAGGATNVGNASSTNTILGTTAVTGIANVNTTGTAATNIGTAGGATNVGNASSTNTILGTTAVTGIANVNTTGTAATNIGTAGGATNVGNASSTNTILGTTTVTGTTNINTGGSTTHTTIGGATSTTTIGGMLGGAGSGKFAGTVALTAGTLDYTVTYPVPAGAVVIVTYEAANEADDMLIPYVSKRTGGTSFQITLSGNPSTGAKVHYLIVQP